ncbi:MAG: DNA alkylation repair protein [Chloroflexi bacterium]|nr:DNA alkylation repair protein [Chloroflexota bacterium]
MQIDEVMDRLRSLSNPEAVAGMARFGINPRNTWGISIPKLREMAKDTGRDHLLAQQLWASGVHEARILASMVDDSRAVTERQIEEWAKDFDSWDVCDQCCANLFDKTSFAYQKVAKWSTREEEFVKRAGFVLMACLAVHDKKAEDDRFEEFFPLIRSGAADGRNNVMKAVNWALRQIGKRNLYLNSKAVEAARDIQSMGSRSGRWVASDALRELTSDKVRRRLRAKA